MNVLELLFSPKMNTTFSNTMVMPKCFPNLTIFRSTYLVYYKIDFRTDFEKKSSLEKSSFETSFYVQGVRSK